MNHDHSITLRRSSIVADYLLLMKPELTLLSVLTAVCSAYLAMRGSLHAIFLLHTFIGTTLVGGTAGALNQYIERRYDALMKRTERRPLPSGRVQPFEALFFGLVLALAGLFYLVVFTNWVAVFLSVLTLVSYLAIYTPLKRKTPFATMVGGIPGSLPPLIGWAIVQGGLSREAWALFFILFFWQIPHFLSLAWMYRLDYARAGYRLLTVIDPSGAVTCRQIFVYSAALVPASIMPMLVGLTGAIYFVCALMLSVGFLFIAIRMYRIRTNSAAHNLFFASLFFLPALFMLMMF
jgi:heme o synthase